MKRDDQCYSILEKRDAMTLRRGSTDIKKQTNIFCHQSTEGEKSLNKMQKTRRNKNEPYIFGWCNKTDIILQRQIKLEKDWQSGRQEFKKKSLLGTNKITIL